MTEIIAHLIFIIFKGNTKLPICVHICNKNAFIYFYMALIFIQNVTKYNFFMAKVLSNYSFKFIKLFSFFTFKFLVIICSYFNEFCYSLERRKSTS